MTKTRVFFVSDVHGSDRLFYKFVNAAGVYKAQVLIIGGDIAGKAITPIFSEDGSAFVTELQGIQKTASGKDQLEAIQKEIRAIGNYPYVTTRKDWAEATQDEMRMDEIFDVLIVQSIERWCNVAKERLKSQNVKVFINKGNDDPKALEDAIRASDYVEYPNERIVNIDDKHEMLSLGYSNITPWHLPGDISEEEIERKLNEVARGLQNPENSIFNIHVPPYNTHLDVAPKLDDSLRPILTPGGEPEFAHVGSTAVRKGIETYKPLVGVHGHIHESKGYTKIGHTHCFNPGSEYAIGLLKGVILNFSDQKLDNHLFTSG
ncbi:MAG: metallophosphoesterase [Nitrososphaerota archaeon]|nr:metallophosphoesterase [Nitrososphaerota archaeon]